jgi:hypothetical protein
LENILLARGKSLKELRGFKGKKLMPEKHLPSHYGLNVKMRVDELSIRADCGIENPTLIIPTVIEANFTNNPQGQKHFAILAVQSQIYILNYSNRIADNLFKFEPCEAHENFSQTSLNRARTFRI